MRKWMSALFATIFSEPHMMVAKAGTQINTWKWMTNKWKECQVMRYIYIYKYIYIVYIFYI